MYHISSVAMITHYINIQPNYMAAKQDITSISPFVTEYMRQDGMLILRLIECNTNQVVMSELIGSLYRHFKKYYSLSNGDDEDGKEMDRSDAFTRNSTGLSGRLSDNDSNDSGTTNSCRESLVLELALEPGEQMF